VDVDCKIIMSFCLIISIVSMCPCLMFMFVSVLCLVFVCESIFHSFLLVVCCCVISFQVELIIDG
jgi:hypothetical protein